MDPSWQPVMSAAQRRKQRRLRSWWRHEQQSIAAALATFTHHSALRGQRTARAREGGSETKNTAEDRRTPPPEEPGTQYYGLDDDDSVPELSGGRPGPVLDPGPPVAGMGRHTGEAFELVLDPVVPQLGRDLAEQTSQELVRLIVETLEEVEQAEREREQLKSGSRSSNKMGKRRKRKKRRKKKLPKTSSSTSSRCRERNQGAVEYAEDGEDEVTIENEQRENSSSVSWLDLGDAVVDDVQEFFADEAGAGFSWLRVGNKLSGDGLQRDLNLREEWCGSKLDSLECFSCSWATGYATRCSSYDTCYASVLTKHSDTVREANASVVRWCKSCLVAARMECMAKAIKAVKDVTWLLFDDSLDLGLQLGRINAVSGRIHRMIKTGQLSIDDDDEKLGNDDDPKFKTMGPGGEKLHDGSHAEFVEFSGSLGTARSLLRSSAGPAEAGWQSYEVSEFMDLVPRG